MAPSLLLNGLVPVAVAAFLFYSANGHGLQVGFYTKTCPQLEGIVRRTTASFICSAPSLAASLLRMHFHDCFVRGCDGSVLINSTSSNQAEKAAIPNLSLQGFQVIDAVKEAVEEQCPGIVSCADILALVARDAVSMARGPRWEVPTGRRDGRVSIANEALLNLPSPFSNITQLKAAFEQKGLSMKDLVVLSGGHTIGMAHCPAFTNRIYNFTGIGDTDPTLEPNYVIQLREKCQPGDVTSSVEMDPGSSKIFDTHYFTLVSKRRGLFQSDAALLNDSETKNYISLQINSTHSSFFYDFGVSMVKMGNIRVLTGSAGEIRKHCWAINQ